MKFANPQFLWALFSLIIPILIHLFHFRRFKIVYFTNVRFLRELRKETQSRSRIRKILILIARCLALAALVFAFARPYIPGDAGTSKGDRAVSIYIDNSFSMESRSESSSLLELARKHAQDIVKSYGNSDRFQLLSNELEGRQMQWLTKDQFNERLEELQLSAVPRLSGKIIERQIRNIREAQKNGVVYVLSDFQRSSTRFDEIKSDTSVSVHLIRLEAGITDNISLDSCWYETPYREAGNPDKLLFSVKNYSSNRFDNLPVKLSVDGVERGLESISAGADSSLSASVVFSTPGKGLHQAELRLSDYPVSFDDVLYFSYSIPEKLKVLIVKGASDRTYLEKLYGSQAIFEMNSVPENQIDYSVFPSQNLIILEEPTEISSGLSLELGKFVSNGGSLVVLPDPDKGSEALNALSGSILSGKVSFGAESRQAQKVASINEQHPLFDDVFERKQEQLDLPQITRSIPFRASGGTEDVIMRLQNGDPFLASYTRGKGKVYFSAASLNADISNFGRHALFIPVFYKIALYSIPQQRLYYYPGEDAVIELSQAILNPDNPVKIRTADNSFETIPEQRVLDGKLAVYTRNSVSEAGNYKLMQGDSLLGVISFNYNRMESDPAVLTSEEIAEATRKAGLNNVKISDGSGAELPSGILLADQGKQFWKLFIILALVFLALETLLIRLK